MKLPWLFAMALAGAIAAGCPSPEARVAPRAPAWQDTGTPADSVVTVTPEIRYYRDSDGAIWNDRGKRISGS